MIPDLPHLSAPTVAADFLQPYDRAKAPLVDYARGGVALLDASKGLNVKNWMCEASDDGVYISASGIQPFKVETLIGAPVWLSFCFDQNMHYNLAYTLRSGESYLYWYDAAQNRYVNENVGALDTPFLRMDDVRDAAIGDRDIIFSYIKDGALCVKVQRDRFGVEYTLAQDVGTQIIQCGMNKGLRFQWYVA